MSPGRTASSLSLVVRLSAGALTILATAVPAVAQAEAEVRYKGKTVSQWTALLKHPEEKIRQQAVEALGAIGPDAKAAVSELVRALADDSPAVRTGALAALAKMGPVGESAVPALVQALKDRDPA